MCTRVPSAMAELIAVETSREGVIYGVYLKEVKESVLGETKKMMGLGLKG